MIILFKCPQCGRAHNVKSELGGRKARCACGQELTIPVVREDDTTETRRGIALDTTGTASGPVVPAQANSSSQARPDSQGKVRWYDRGLLVLSLLVLFFPVGAYGLWRNSHYSRRSKILLGVTGFALAVAIGQQLTEQVVSAPTDITWKQYMDECGTTAQEVNKTRAIKVFEANYKGKQVRWAGIVDSVSPGLLGGTRIGLKMSPTESFGADVVLKVPDNVDVSALNRGAILECVARIDTQGGPILPHELAWIGPATGATTPLSAQRPTSDTTAVPPHGMVLSQAQIMPATWKDFMSACGTAAQQANEIQAVDLFEKQFKGKVVKWSGVVDRISTSIRGEAQIWMKMSPTESLGPDLVLNAPRNLDLKSIRKGDTVEFLGQIETQGGAFTPHVLYCDQVPVREDGLTGEAGSRLRPEEKTAKDRSSQSMLSSPAQDTSDLARASDLDSHMIRELVRNLNHPDNPVVDAATGELSTYKDKAVPVLKEFILDSTNTTSGRLAAITSLWQISSQLARSALRDCAMTLAKRTSSLDKALANACNDYARRPSAEHPEDTDNSPDSQDTAGTNTPDSVQKPSEDTPRDQPGSEIDERLNRLVTLKKPYPKVYPNAPTDRITAQYVAILVAEQVGLQYDFKTSFTNTNPKCRQWIYPEFEGIPCNVALKQVLDPLGLTYELKGDRIVLQKKR
ncbi:MAG TPA: hypothetical protein PLL20_01400 [Phycisphaerae bacterium]|nr:hypothetical protein [Phycisphaerae bacterium]HRR84541.1 hypothetical protein [Phycisphaerae bacterium]